MKWIRSISWPTVIFVMLCVITIGALLVSGAGLYYDYTHSPPPPHEIDWSTRERMIIEQLVDYNNDLKIENAALRHKSMYPDSRLSP